MQERDFKGVWIPKQIWLDTRLNALDKIILTEIDSLDNENGCSAGNEYLANFCQCSETKISTAISKLIQYGYIYQKSFDGRTRILKSRLSNFERQDLKNLKADFKNFKGNNIDNNLYNNKEKINKKEKTIEEQLKEQDVELQSVLLRFLEMRKKIKKPMTDYAFKLLLNKLEKLSGGFAGNKIMILDQSIVNCWQDIYALKVDKFSGFNKELVDYAKELANGKSDNYVLAILNNWKSQNITTLETAKQSNNLFIKGIGVNTTDYVLRQKNNCNIDFDDVENIEI